MGCGQVEAESAMLDVALCGKGGTREGDTEREIERR